MLGIGRMNAGSDWSPLLLSGLVAWYRADMGVSKTGTTVTAWADQSGNGLDVIPGTSPVYSATGVNGKPGVAFEEWQGAQRLTRDPVTALNGKTALSFFLVEKVGSAGAGRHLCGQMWEEGCQELCIWAPNNTNIGFRADVNWNDPGNGQTTDGSYIGGAVNILEFHFKGAAATNAAKFIIYLNDAQKELTFAGNMISATGTSDTGFCVGAIDPIGWNSGWSGIIGDLLIFNTSSGVDNRAVIYSYLKTRYGL